MGNRGKNYFNGSVSTKNLGAYFDEADLDGTFVHHRTKKTAPKQKFEDDDGGDDYAVSGERIERRRDRLNHTEQKSQGFTCTNKSCRKFIPMNNAMGTQNRNHCPFCLNSRHMDEKSPGDRASECQSRMVPVALTFKQEGQDRYKDCGHKQGELMIVHACTGCERVNVNRVAADDMNAQIEAVFTASQSLSDDLVQRITGQNIRILDQSDTAEIQNQLYGKKLPGWRQGKQARTHMARPDIR